jgi:hypothetical protein
MITKCNQQEVIMKIQLSAEQTKELYTMMWPELLRIRNEKKYTKSLTPNEPLDTIR